MGTWEFNAWGKLCDGLASHPAGSRNTPSHFMLNKLQPEGPVGSYADFICLPY